MADNWPDFSDDPPVGVSPNQAEYDADARGDAAVERDREQFEEVSAGDAFVYAVDLAAPASGFTDSELLTLGESACRGLDDPGVDPQDVADSLVAAADGTMTTTTAGAIVNAASEHLCP